MNTLFVSGMDVTREQYKNKHYCKHEIVLLETFFLYIYLTPDWVGKCLGTYQNNATHI